MAVGIQDGILASIVAAARDSPSGEAHPAGHCEVSLASSKVLWKAGSWVVVCTNTILWTARLCRFPAQVIARLCPGLPGPCDRAHRARSLVVSAPMVHLSGRCNEGVVRRGRSGCFIGKEALSAQKNNMPLKKRLVSFKLHDPNPILFHEELIRCDGRIVGYISSGVKSFTIGTSIGMGYVHHSAGVTKDLIDNSRWQIEIAGNLYEADASLRAFFDPNGDRAKR
ncbi:glycine cleavage T C-terminal barrel domain-containing protein [Mesorhizobium ciceri]|uniref:glycine cleavage T C-terminal barrel domain-containing protein n=1 Tax=Mesorhizobium TaxID=68287 RepID=UPI001FD8781F|nr:glycine cleavage T C-terminal barrel domain-containing protein [Mesorhizobium ciceri]